MVQKVELFEKYKVSANLNVKKVEKAVRSGALLTRRESFDSLFKMCVTGNTKKFRLIDMDKFDKDLAKFVACYFLKIVDFNEYGYSFSSIKKFVSGILFRAWYDGISSSRCKAVYADKDGVLGIKIIRFGSAVLSFKVDSIDSLLDMCTQLISYLTSDSEVEDKKFLANYIYVEVSRYLLGNPTKIYVDKRKHSLGDAIKAAEKEVNTKPGKIIQVKFG